jgi:hypothetical protein
MCSAGCGSSIQSSANKEVKAIEFATNGFTDEDIAIVVSLLEHCNETPIIFPGETTPRKLKLLGVRPTGHTRNNDGSITILGVLQFSESIHLNKQANFTFIQEKLLWQPQPTK